MTLPAAHAHDGLPLYRQIARQLQAEIVRTLKPGDQIAPEHDLASRFVVNRHTVRRAIDVLADAGLLIRRQGLGTYVTEAPIDYSIAGRTRFTENLEAAGRRAVSRIVRKQVIGATGGIAERLELQEGQDVICLESLRMADDRPVCITSMYVPFADAPEVLTEYTQGSLHRFIEQRYGFSPRRSYSLVTAMMPIGQDAMLLMMPANLPVLRVKSVNVNPHSGSPIEYSITRFRSDRIQLRLDLDQSGTFQNTNPQTEK